MKTLIILLMSAPALMALDDPTYPIHENGEYLCFVSGVGGGPSKCELWLFGRQLGNGLVEAYKLRRYGRIQGGATASIGGKPKGEYEKESVVLNLNQFSYLRLMRIRRDWPPVSAKSSLHNWNADENFKFKESK